MAPTAIKIHKFSQYIAGHQLGLAPLISLTHNAYHPVVPTNEITL